MSCQCLYIMSHRDACGEFYSLWFVGADEGRRMILQPLWALSYSVNASLNCSRGKTLVLQDKAGGT